ncbi:hypothetical protein TRVA0_022S00870 [Trichomonascus vanleenenianus]|uniref:uncharacterized protein n=1 Tax=Trichomonascus vanleenenianus TaxID=2268995 RepID=UPI003ECB7D42
MIRDRLLLAYRTRSLRAVLDRRKAMYSTKISLEAAYDRTLEQIVADHQPLLREKFLDPENADQGYDSYELALSCRDCNEYINRLIIKHAHRAFSAHHDSRKLRKTIEREDIGSIADYNQFLRSLYSRKGKEIDYRALFRAYQHLPYPPPRSIQPQHLEDLVSITSSGWQKSGFWSKRSNSSARGAFFLSLLNDLKECDFPISTRENNSAIHIIGESVAAKEEDERWAAVDEKIADIKHCYPDGRLSDVSTLNILLALAFRHGEESLANRLSSDFAANGVLPDRFTMILYILWQGKQNNAEGVGQLSRDLERTGYVVDIAMMNVIMKALISCGEVNSAEKLLHSVVKSVETEDELQVSLPRNGAENARLLNKLKLMDYIIRITRTESGEESPKSYSVPVIPDRYTFSPFIKHYCQVGDFPKLREALGLLGKLDAYLLPKRDDFYKIFGAFKRYSRTGTQWNLDAFKSIIRYMMDCQRIATVEHSAFEYDYYTYAMAQMVLKAYRDLGGDKPIEHEAELADLARQSLERTKTNAATRKSIVHSILKGLV